MTNVMKDVGYHGPSIELGNIADLLLEDISTLLQYDILDVSKQVQQANDQFKGLDQLLWQ